MRSSMNLETDHHNGGRNRLLVILMFLLLFMVLVNIALTIVVVVLTTRKSEGASSADCSTPSVIPTGSVTTPTPPLVSDAELAKMGNQLWGRDVQTRAKKADIQLNNANATLPLFKYVNPEVLNRTSFVLLREMFDNYEPAIGVEDPRSASLDLEIETFLNHTLASSVMRHTWQFLARVGLASKALEGFREELRQYWFQPFSRSSGTALDSTGFEHVFLGQVRNSSVTGFHNWLYYYHEEQKGRAQFVNEIRKCRPNTISFSMKWLGRDKPITVITYGVSPEFEMALYTLCFLARPNQICKTSLNGFPIVVQTYTMRNVSPTTVGTTYIKC